MRLMIPYALTLKNFLSYGNTPQTISFQGYGLICLSGKNGHGKSALLDAITWSLWGQARKTTGTSKPDEGLLRLGSTSMLVVFEFLSKGKRYRVRREFTLSKGKPVTALDFGVYDDASQAYQSLTDKSIRITQQVIERTIGLDYHTYINSAFLRQGNSNEFSSKSPKDRKKILASILGVDQYDALQSKALETVRGLAQEKKILRSLQEQDEAVIATKQEIADRLAVVEKERVALEKHLADATQHVATAQSAHEQFRARVAQYEERIIEIKEMMASLTRERQEWFTKTNEWRRELYSLQSLPSRSKLDAELELLLKEEKEAYQRDALKLKAREDALLKKEQRAKVEQARIAAQAEAKVARLAYETAHGKLEQVTKLYAAAQNQFDTIMGQRQSVYVQLAHIDKQQAQRDAAIAQFEKRKSFYSSYTAQRDGLMTMAAECETRIHQLSESGAQGCPLCEQMLSARRKERLARGVETEHARLARKSHRLTTILGRLKELLAVQREQVAALQEQAAQKTSLLTRRDELEKTIREQETVCKQLQEEQEERVAQKKDAEKTLHVAREKEQKCNAECEVFKEDVVVVTEQKAATRTVQEIQVLIADVRARRNALDHIAHRTAALKTQRTLLSEQRIRLQREEKKLVERQEKMRAQGVSKEHGRALAEQLKNATERRAHVTQQKDALLPEIGRLKTKLERVAAHEAQFAQREKEIARIDREAEDYEAIAAAWGKNGIQALLIERAIPEIEQEANALLARLSKNQAQVFIESQRDLKRGGVRETLDVKISDTLGVRPYEMFSGGEAFRIDFSLRIALSKLLARRSGAALQVLIIDEGFGSQDEEGLQRLMDALYTIQDEFEKIIIVSHLNSFKDNFPVHFVVSKQSTGSIVTIEERG